MLGLLGVLLLAFAGAAFYFAMPRDGKVVNFLRADTAQSLYVTMMIVAFGLGVMSIGAYLSGVDPFELG